MKGSTRNKKRPGGRIDTIAVLSSCCVRMRTCRSSSPMLARAMRVEGAILHTQSGREYVVGALNLFHGSDSMQDLEVRRRYSEFASLRATLVNLHPTLIIPPIPEKHSMADYAAKPTKAKEDTSIIDLRKRMLAVFLNRCKQMKEVREDGVWWRFLDPNASWVRQTLHRERRTNSVLRTRYYILLLWPQYRKASCEHRRLTLRILPLHISGYPFPLHLRS